LADFDVIVLGAGPNGLGMSGMLAKEGMKVVLVEKNDHVGGLASNSYFWPGYTHNTGAWWLSIDKIESVWKTLGVGKYCPETFSPPGMGSTLGLTPNDKAHHMIFDPIKQMVKIQNDFGQNATDSFGKIFKYFEPFSMGIKPMLYNVPLSVGQLVDRMPSIEARNMLNQIFYGTAADLIDEYFPDKGKTGALRGTLAAAAADGFWGGPMTPGSLMKFAYQVATHSGGTKPGLVKGGIGKFSEALAEAYKAISGMLMLNSEIKRIILEKDRATGIELINGDTITAKYIISSLDTANTFMRLIGESNIPAFVAKQIKKINYRCHFMQAFCRCSGLPEYKDKLEYFNTEGWRWCVGYWPSLELIEQCWDDVKLGRIPEKGIGAYSCMSMLDPSLSPQGKHTMTVFTNYMWPQGVPADKVDEVKEICFQKIVDSLCQFAPNFRDIIDDHVVMAPPDYEKRFNNTGGDWAHGQIQLNQLFDNRPIQGMSGYKVPFIKNMWLCGSSNHPGPGVNFIPVLNCLNVFKKEVGLGKK
jgi:phytoene dehydrogenase-like protein